jgi:hypothetical protein
MRNMFALAVTAALAAVPGAAMADGTGQYGDVQVVNSGPASNPTVFQLTSSNTPTPGYAGIYFEFTSPLTLADITQLSADYQMTVGTFGNGAPRFTIFDNADHAAYVYFGTPQAGGGATDPNAGSYANTGNYADLTSADLRVESNGFGGYSTGPLPHVTWADLVANAGGTLVHYVTIDLDGGYAQPNGQQMLTDNFTVNGNVLAAGAVPEPATWAMLILGFGFAGAAMRQRRGKTAVSFG